MSKNERFWRETMDKLDEKYVNETSEELFGRLGERRELVEVHVERPEKKKKGVGAWIGLAAALTVVVGTAAVLRMTNVFPAKPNEGIEITLPSETTPITAEVPASETTMVLPLPERHISGMQNFEGIEIYEDIFWGNWRNSAEKIRFTYKEDPLPEEAVAAAVTKQDEGYFLQVYGQGEYGGDVDIGVYYIPAGETDKLYFYENAESTTAQIYTRSGKETYTENGLAAEKGKLNFMGQQKLARAMSIDENDGFYHLRRIYETPLYNADGVRLDILYGSVILGENVSLNEPNKFTLTVNCKYSDSEIYEQITLSLRRGEKSWKIVSASDANGNIYTTDLAAGSTELIDNDVLNGDGLASKEIMALFEETFYGVWESDFDTLSMTYTEDNQVLGNTRITTIAEREDGWYLNVFSGGTGVLYFIAREEPEKMYRYEDFTGVNEIPKNGYYCVYRLRSRGSTEIPQGVISLLGMKKIFIEYGVDIWGIMPENITYNGKEYNYGEVASWYWGYGETYINEPVTDSRVVFSHRYCENRDDIDELNKPDMKYFTFAAEKINGEWESWEITDTYTTLEVSEEYIVQYFNDKDGRYYALETLVAMSSHHLSMLYHWDGYSYTAVSENLINCYAAEIDGVVYLLYYDKSSKTLRLRENRMCVGKNVYTETIVSESGSVEVYPNSYSMRTVGDYIIVEYDETDTDTRSVSIYSKYLDFCGKTTESYVTELSDSGFKMIISGEEIAYTTDENDLAGRLWHLNRSSEMFYRNIFVGSPTIDLNDNFTEENSDSDIPMTYYRVLEPPFDDYLSLRIALHEIFTEDACDDIEINMFENGRNFEIKDNAIYSADGARGSDISVGSVICRIKEQTDTQAVLEYTVYGVDENFNVSGEIVETYEITAKNDGRGWRLDKMCWPY